MLQFARAHAGVFDAAVPHLGDDGCRLGHAALLRCLPLVVGLAAVTKVLASPLNAQALGLGVLQDLPEGFFRTRTP